MALAEVFTRALTGISTLLVTVEIDISKGLPGFTLVGLSDSITRGIRARVRSAIINSGYHFPARKITLSLTPSDCIKEGYGYDLPIAIAVLVASGQVNPLSLSHYEFYGELSLDGTLNGCKGTISALLAAPDSNHHIIVASEFYNPDIAFNQDAIFFADDLKQVCRYIQGDTLLRPHRPDFIKTDATPLYKNDLETIIGQQHAKRAIEIAAAGGHSLLMGGPPGTGKTTLANCLAGLLPPLTNDEKIAIAEVSNLLSSHLVFPLSRPFRSPHHSITPAGLIGTTQPLSVGEITLAHQGVLFLDELMEFDKKTLEALRTPLEKGSVLLSRAKKQVTYPAKFHLIAAMNFPFVQIHSQTKDQRKKHSIDKSLERLSAALIDRFQLSVEVSSPVEKRLTLKEESGKCVRERVSLARHKQMERQGKENARLCSSEVNFYCPITESDRAWLNNYYEKFLLSPRSVLHIIQVARTITDLNGETTITRHSLQEALSYRYTDRIIHYLTHFYN
ncbi:YifB family Mg chelatase-like AAA ATPase [Rosenbergiella australiborealis]|uniref:YifB family Mg chelatase-like AAA ATPase n=2 Tax=Rosenbergiella TaxID=1356488 RepID=A0ABS5T539_9GAMM|nr:YifB family Mg chelatase-like AAA ATPase [Rosenbergiella australiborealis]MBT0727456.1 YifB family Mg chelatase-like AAA ATPase [Rosenbergiella australiborealis]